jgi:hypothetical protein
MEVKSKLIGFSSLIFISISVRSQPRVMPAAYYNGVNVNYIRTWQAKSPQSDPSKFTINSPIDSCLITTEYLDGLGRPNQTVIKQGSMITNASPQDMVSAIEYDQFGRPQYQYLPFAANNTGGNLNITNGLFKLNPFQQDSTFSKTQYQGENYFYGRNIIEPSPLNRVTKSLAPGDNWIGDNRGISYQHLVNTNSDSVRIWEITSDIASTIPTTSFFYTTGFKAIC